MDSRVLRVRRRLGFDTWTGCSIDAFSSTAILNLVENSLNILYLILARQKSPVAILIGFTAVLLTFWKTT